MRGTVMDHRLEARVVVLDDGASPLPEQTPLLVHTLPPLEAAVKEAF